MRLGIGLGVPFTAPPPTGSAPAPSLNMQLSQNSQYVVVLFTGI